MRALTISQHGGLEQLTYTEDAPTPELAGGDEVRVRVHAAALNHLDLYVLHGAPGVTITPGWVMGGDGAGVVDAVGASVTNVKVGDRVLLNPGVSDRTCEYCRMGEHSLCVKYALLGEHRAGTLADYIVVPAANAWPVPPGVSWEVAAAYPLATLTAWRMVVTRAQVKAEDLVLIWGIGGGVALAALQLVKRIGARAWVTSGSDEKLARARAMGADETFNHRTQDVAKEVRARTGKRGADVVIDSVGADTWKQSLLALGKRGRLVTCGGTSGPMLETDVRRLFWNQWTLMGSTMGNDREFAAIVAALGRGELLPPVDSVFPLSEGRAAFARLESGAQFGKIVVRVAGA
ncbi:MAG TPA: zinc-binding dehydrogenase [Gemmatimonadaceae bacterium]|nr:zinc-binding dehydrogenase [Gemmatimonadaceae bacterium]